ncbi:MAG TPA: hypothetical protein VNH20_03695 [Candidatus Dormibacteraeota bacterium]|nr:hypothetical protein [Candidatus Dormibacteraeota bacterium]
MSQQVQTPPQYEAAPLPSGSMDPEPVNPTQTTPPPARPARGRRGGFRISELILLSVAVVDLFLGLDFLFRAAAIGSGGFVAVVDRVGGALASPFSAIFRPGVPPVGHTTDWAALLALVIYTLAALVLVRLIHLLTDPLRRRPAAV